MDSLNRGNRNQPQQAIYGELWVKYH